MPSAWPALYVQSERAHPREPAAFDPHSANVQSVMMTWILRIGPAAQCRVADKAPRADHSDVRRVHGVNEAHMTRHPLALPTHLRDRVIGEIGRSQEAGIFSSPSVVFDATRAPRSDSCPPAPAHRLHPETQQRSMACWMAAVSLVEPSPLAPQSRTRIESFDSTVGVSATENAAIGDASNAVPLFTKLLRFIVPGSSRPPSRRAERNCAAAGTSEASPGSRVKTVRRRR